jgi:NADPH-dependent F420 reductase
MNTDDSIGIIGGTGAQGWGLALRWAAAGKKVRIGSRLKERAQEGAQKIRDILGTKSAEIEAFSNTELVATTSLLVLAVPFAVQIPTLTALRHSFRSGQMLIDCTVPLETTVGGSAVRLLGVWEGSAAEQTARHVPANIAVAAAFQNISADALRNIASLVECDVLVCADAGDNRERVRPWVEAIPGCRYVDGGRLENARLVESLTALLIGLNRRYKMKDAGIRITDLPESGRL